MRVLVTGGAGYIGSHTVRLLGEAGHEVTVYDNLERGHREAVRGFNLITGEVNNTGKLREVLSRNSIDAVMHFAAYGLVGESVKRPDLYYRNNVIAGLTLLEEVVKSRIKYLIFSSSAAVYGEPEELPVKENHILRPVNPYGETKMILENALNYIHKAYGLKFISLRYFNAAGASPQGDIGEDHEPETHLIPLVLQAALGKRDGITIYGDDYPTRDGFAVRDFIHVDDLARAHVLALHALERKVASSIYNLGNGKGHSIREVIKASEKVVGRTIPYKLAPRRKGDPAALVASPEKAERELGWKRRYASLESIIETAWKWHKERPDGYR